jgi:hypothetical protein
VEKSSQGYNPFWIYEKLEENEGIENNNTYEINAVQNKSVYSMSVVLERDVKCLPFPTPSYFSDQQNK